MHAPGNGPAFAIYYSLLAAFGVLANLATIVILSRGRCGLSKCITQYLISMAVTDFLVIIAAVILSRLRVIYFPANFLSTTPGCSVIIVFSCASRDSSVWLTVAFTFDRYLAICCPELKTKYCTEKTAVVVITVVCMMCCLKNIPFYFIYEPMYMIDKVPWYCSIKASNYISIAWRVYDWLDRILTPCLPFVLILLLNVLTVRHILLASRVRRRLRAERNGKNQGDSEMESRRKSIVLLFAISGSFLLLWLTYVVNFLFVQISGSNYSIGSNANDPKFILQECGYMLQLLSSCTNTCIYAGTQTKFRRELKDAFKLFFNLIAKLHK
ncbi:probable G-protein coupled receptor 139 [Stegostoma tigrinum]|uniref:probable G-protein coupled receptor 139 n=1 Tax=Stegostoma tigrinum TaxID=3053191 RepID=UPI0028703B50|nr:probable G-protein coupled receptor 139 [Stegostoma tigrinum]XP_059500507.1 probable G-protein coupled receptor 139 [Stegostoma tigrinum]